MAIKGENDHNLKVGDVVRLKENMKTPEAKDLSYNKNYTILSFSNEMNPVITDDSNSVRPYRFWRFERLSDIRECKIKDILTK